MLPAFLSSTVLRPFFSFCFLFLYVSFPFSFFFLLYFFLALFSPLFPNLSLPPSFFPFFSLSFAVSFRRSLTFSGFLCRSLPISCLLFRPFSVAICLVPILFHVRRALSACHPRFFFPAIRVLQLSFALFPVAPLRLPLFFFFLLPHFRGGPLAVPERTLRGLREASGGYAVARGRAPGGPWEAPRRSSGEPGGLARLAGRFWEGWRRDAA